MKTYESQINEEFLDQEALLESYVPGIDNPIAILRDMNNNQEFDDDEVFFYTKDHLGSIRELVGLDGKLKQRQRYSAYGVTTREKNTDEMDRLIDHAYGFTGRELDSETGLYFYRARYYSNSDNIGRFISEDPIGFEGEDMNFYRYVENSPVSYLDGFGTKKIPASTGAVDPILTCQKRAVKTGLEQAMSVGGAISSASSSMLAGCGFTGPAAPACINGVSIIMGISGAVAVGSCVKKTIETALNCENLLK